VFLPPDRLAPSDIHRLHASVTGRVVRIRRHGTRFMGSEHAAIHSRLDVLTENDRCVLLTCSRAFTAVLVPHFAVAIHVAPAARSPSCY